MGDELRGHIRHRQLQDLYDHWRGLWRGSLLPLRAALDPLAMPRGLLGNLGILDVEREPKLRFRYRLYGTNLIDISGQDRTGRYADEPGMSNMPELVLPALARVASTGEPELLSGDYSREQFRYVAFEVLLLPLADDGRAVSHILCGLLRDRRPGTAGGFGIF